MSGASPRLAVRAQCVDQEGQPKYDKYEPMTKVGREPKWLLLERSACARAMIPVTMRMMPRRRLLFLESLLMRPPAAR